MSVQDTIVAVATAPGTSALAIVRASGPLVPAWAAALGGKNGSPPPPRWQHLVRLLDGDGCLIDEGLLCYFAENASYTGEAVLEFSGHGNPFIVEKILEDWVRRGGRLARPGEFTQRAFLNGRLDLAQAEAVAAVISARSEASLQLAHRALEGETGRRLSAWVDELLRAQAAMEAYIDFPEEDLPPEEEGGPFAELRRLARELRALAGHERATRLSQEGIAVVIAGETNVGKSSLMNALLGMDRALVSAEAGTTRDYLSEPLRLGPHLLRLLDTAGWRAGAVGVEDAGIARSLQRIREADLVLHVVEAGCLPPEEAEFADPHWREAMQGRPVLRVANKVDQLPAGAKPPPPPWLAVSATEHIGLGALRDALQKEADHLVRVDRDTVMISARQAASLESAARALDEACGLLVNGEGVEWAAQSVRASVNHLREIMGWIDNEAMLDRLFANFCIGK